MKLVYRVIRSWSWKNSILIPALSLTLFNTKRTGALQLIVRLSMTNFKRNSVLIEGNFFHELNLDIKFIINFFACILLHICSVVFQVPNGHNSVFFENRTTVRKKILVTKFYKIIPWNCVRNSWKYWKLRSQIVYYNCSKLGLRSGC